METAEPDVDGYLIRLDHLSLGEVLHSQDNALAEALRELMRANSVDGGDTVSAFANFVQ